MTILGIQRFILNYISYFFGIFAEIEFKPIAWISKLVLVKLYKPNLEEAEFPLSHYKSLSAFFIRNLKAGTRLVEGDVVCPCDGFLRSSGIIENSSMLQVKGKLQSISELLGSKEDAKKYEGGEYFNFYLAPHNYHHVHLPVDAEIQETIFFPGFLFPVNDLSVNNVDNLFSRNERILIKLKSNDKSCALIMVGALNVGKMSLEYVKTPYGKLKDLGRQVKLEHPIISYKKADKIGTFHLGSTVILLFESGFFSKKTRKMAYKLPVRLGESLINA